MTRNLAEGKQGGRGWGEGGGTGGGVGDAGVETCSSTVLKDFDFARELEMRGGVMLLACKHHGQGLSSEDAAHAAGGPEICSEKSAIW